jgi:hypothetical protein
MTSESFGKITLVLWNDGPAARRWMVVDVMAAGSVVEDKAILFKKANDLARLDRGELRHHLRLYQLRIP